MKIEKALVVDDSRVAHLNLRRLLTERNIEVDWVGSGEDCLVYLKRQKPDIIFMDVMMPGMDGFDTTGTINTDPSIHAPPVIMCSANATDEDRRNAEKNGAVEFLSKPYTAEKLDHILATVSGFATAVAQHSEPIAAEQYAAVQPDTPRVSHSQAPSVPVPEKSVTPVFDLPRITQAAERAARATAEEVARKVAAELARAAAEKTIRIAIRESETVARGIAKDVSGEIARAVAEETAGVVAEQVARRFGDEMSGKKDAAAQDIGADGVENLRISLHAELAKQAQDVVGKAMQGDDFKQHVMQAVGKAVHPLVESSVRETAARIAQQTAIQVVEEATRPAEQASETTGRAALSRANLALAAGMIALAVAVALKLGM